MLVLMLSTASGHNCLTLQPQPPTISFINSLLDTRSSAYCSMNIHFIFLTLCLCLAVFTPSEHTIFLLIQHLEGLINSPFLSCTFTSQTQLAVICVSLYLLSRPYCTYFLDLEIRWVFFLTSFCFSFLLACSLDSIHLLSTLLSTHPQVSIPVPAVCPSICRALSKRRSL